MIPSIFLGSLVLAILLPSLFFCGSNVLGKSQSSQYKIPNPKVPRKPITLYSNDQPESNFNKKRH